MARRKATFIVIRNGEHVAEGVIECEHCGQPCREMVMADAAETK